MQTASSASRTWSASCVGRRVDGDRGADRAHGRHAAPGRRSPRGWRRGAVRNGPASRLEGDDVLAGVHEILVLDQEAQRRAPASSLWISWKFFMISTSPTTSPGSTRRPRSTYGSACGLEPPVEGARQRGLDRRAPSRGLQARGGQRSRRARGRPRSPRSMVTSRKRTVSPTGRNWPIFQKSAWITVAAHDEAAGGRPVRPEDHGQVAVDVDRARPDSCCRGCSTGDRRRCPPLVRAHSNLWDSSRMPVRLELRSIGHGAAEERLHVVLRQEVRRRLRAAHRARPPSRGSTPVSQLVRKRRRAPAAVPDRLAERQPVARLQRPAVETAERAHRVRGARAEKQRDVEAAVDGEVEQRKPGPGARPIRDLGAGGHAMALPQRDALAVHASPPSRRRRSPSSPRRRAGSESCRA